MTTWYADPTARIKHRGSVHRGRVATSCGTSFRSGAATIELPPGHNPPGDEYCQDCATGRTRQATDEDYPAQPATLAGASRRRWPGPTPSRMVVPLGWLTVAGLAVFLYLAWPR